MRGKTIVITGATSGIGEVAAIALAGQGARIVFTARDDRRADDTLARLRRANPAADHAAHLADLSLLAEQKRVAAVIGQEPQIDVLINNAGALFNKRQETADGLEKTFALNHMSYFTITTLLLAKLKSGARIVTTASNAHRGAKLDFSDLQTRHGYAGFAVYSRSKLCNILFNRALAARLKGSGVTANSLHPGFVATRFGDQSGGVMQRLVKVAKPIGAISPEEGAKTIIHLAASPDVAAISGEYFYESRIAQPTAEARVDADAERLWQVSEEILKGDNMFDVVQRIFQIVALAFCLFMILGGGFFSTQMLPDMVIKTTTFTMYRTLPPPPDGPAFCKIVEFGAYGAVMPCDFMPPFIGWLQRKLG